MLANAMGEVVQLRVTALLAGVHFELGRIDKEHCHLNIKEL